MTNQDAFEDYARRCGSYDITRKVVQDNNTYLRGETEEAWMFWQAGQRHGPDAKDAARWRAVLLMSRSWWLETMKKAGTPTRHGGCSINESMDAALSALSKDKP